MSSDDPRFESGELKAAEPIRMDCLMTAFDYQKYAERTSATGTEEGRNMARERIDDAVLIRMLHGSMGLCTESGELMDQLKKHIFYGKELDIVNIAEECGDLFWYLAETLTAVDRRFVDVMQQNLDKLRARYPEKFTEDKAVNRDLEAERKVLEEHHPVIEPMQVFDPHTGSYNR